MAAARRGSMFQSLGRDSGCSSLNRIMDGNVSLIVSIPRSGFWVFKRTEGKRGQTPTRGFNPSVGILGVQAPPERPEHALNPQFQSLGRDSGCSSHQDGQTRETERKFQSLGRDSGCSSPTRPTPTGQAHAVSIPRSGFWVFKLIASRCRCRIPLVSIPRSGFWVFKLVGGGAADVEAGVSIPRSGFWVFKLAQLGEDDGDVGVSIPRSGFWVFKPSSVTLSS